MNSQPARTHPDGEITGSIATEIRPVKLFRRLLLLLVLIPWLELRLRTGLLVTHDVEPPHMSAAVEFRALAIGVNVEVQILEKWQE